jgi:hypothetical protein
MNLQALQDRAKLLQDELTRATQVVPALTQQLEQAKAHLSMVTGHVNESNFMILECQKSVNESLPVIKEPEHVEAIIAEQGQVA